jgi:hypothetical protein
MLVDCEMPFNGYAPSIYAVSEPGKLPGRHACTVLRELRHGEQIERLLVAPIWDSTGGPFGIRAPRASHALCLTSRRLLLSRDLHRGHAPLEIFNIPRPTLVGLEFGEAMLMSWFTLSWERPGGVAKAGLFTTRMGNEHLTAMIRDWRRNWPMPAQGQDRPGSLAGSRLPDLTHRVLVDGLLTPDEVVLDSWRRVPVWGKRRRWFRWTSFGLAHWGSVLVTNRAIFYVCDALPPGETGLVFSHNVHSIRLSAVRSVEVNHVRRFGLDVACLSLTWGASGNCWLEIPFSKDQATVATACRRLVSSLVVSNERLQRM